MIRPPLSFWQPLESSEALVSSFFRTFSLFLCLPACLPSLTTVSGRILPRASCSDSIWPPPLLVHRPPLSFLAQLLNVNFEVARAPHRHKRRAWKGRLICANECTLDCACQPLRLWFHERRRRGRARTPRSSSFALVLVGEGGGWFANMTEDDSSCKC